VEVTSPGVYGSVSEKFAREKMAFQNPGVVTMHPLGSSTVKDKLTEFKKCKASNLYSGAES